MTVRHLRRRADGCPLTSGSDINCDNDWQAPNVGYASYDGVAVPLTQIYNTNYVAQWTVIREYWVANEADTILRGLQLHPVFLTRRPHGTIFRLIIPGTSRASQG